MNMDRLAAWFAAVHERYMYVMLIVVAVLVRIPFWRTFQLVTYDGTYYLSQTKSLFAGERLPNGFPLGYPFFVGLLHLGIRDLVVAAQSVSLLAGLGAVAALYALARHFVRREYAVLSALLLAVHPLFIRSSLATMSEALGLVLVLSSLLLFVKGRFLPCGLLSGLAAVTRPELGLIGAVLALSKLKNRKQFAAIALGFACVYALNVAVLSRSAGRPVFLNKTHNFMKGRTVQHALLLDDRLDFQEREAALARELAAAPVEHPAVYYIRRLAADLSLLVRHLLPVILTLALVGLWRKRSLVLTAPLLFLPLLPLFAPRSEARFVLPYVPFLLVYAMLGTTALRNRWRPVALILVLVSAAIWPVVNRATLSGSAEEALARGAKRMAAALGDRISATDLIADRKPYLAFYTGARFKLLPAAPYEPTIRFLCDEGFDYLALRRMTVGNRPALKPLLLDESVLLGETRLRVFMSSSSGQVLMAVNPLGDALTWQELPAVAATMSFPAWSADGRRVAYVTADARGRRLIRVCELPRGPTVEIAGDHEPDGHLSWSPGGKRLVFSGGAGENRDLKIVTLATGEVTRFTQEEGADHSPSWSPDGEWIAFVSGRTGQDEVWMRSSATGESRQLATTGGHGFPAFSPGGERVAWTESMKGVAILDLVSGRVSRLDAPNAVHFAPTWSPDGKYLAVTGGDWGNWDIYLARSDGQAALLLTKDPGEQGMPSWSPDGRSLALVSDHGGRKGVWLLGNLDPYLDRLDNPQMFLLD